MELGTRVPFDLGEKIPTGRPSAPPFSRLRRAARNRSFRSSRNPAVASSRPSPPPGCEPGVEPLARALEPPTQDPSVLLVEDDEGLRRAVAQGLRKAGYRVSVAANAHEALERARADPPDAAVIDVLLPDGAGQELAALMREHLRTLPILYVTALTPGVIRDVLFPSPVLYKPFTYRQLVASVRDLLRRR
ncbi:MAG TPA: response regulator [Anaeromyxobacteraceae bacterium]|nr:response regulator [Anaeromyxobacteraceae bacterium]